MNTSWQFYSLSLTDEPLDMIVMDTNCCAEQCTLNRIVKEKLSGKARLATWAHVTRDKLKNFIAILLWMGLNQKLMLAYCSSSCPTYDGKTKGFIYVEKSFRITVEALTLR